MKKKPIGIIFFLVFILLVFIGVGGFFMYYPLNYTEVVKEKSEKYGLEPSLVCAIIRTESRFNIDAVSKKGASGLMQIMEPTAEWAAESIGLMDYDYERIREPQINIEIGCWYISKLISQYDGNIDTALAAYNAGSGNVSKWLGDPLYSKDGNSLSSIPFGETERYVSKIENNKGIYNTLLSIYDEFPFIEKISTTINDIF